MEDHKNFGSGGTSTLDMRDTGSVDEAGMDCGRQVQQLKSTEKQSCYIQQRTYHTVICTGQPTANDLMLFRLPVLLVL